jgi:hypothetical protein
VQTIEERTFGFRVPRPLFEKAEERAEAEMLSVSAYLRPSPPSSTATASKILIGCARSAPAATATAWTTCNDEEGIESNDL